MDLKSFKKFLIVGNVSNISGLPTEEIGEVKVTQKTENEKERERTLIFQRKSLCSFRSDRLHFDQEYIFHFCFVFLHFQFVYYLLFSLLLRTFTSFSAFKLFIYDNLEMGKGHGVCYTCFIRTFYTFSVFRDHFYSFPFIFRTQFFDFSANSMK